MALQDHTWTGLCSNLPASGLQLGVLRDGIVLSWSCLETFSLLKGQVSASLRANLVRWLFILDLIHTGRIVAWARLFSLLLPLGGVIDCRTHRV